MIKLADKRKINSLALFCALAYFISYVSRINLGVVLVEVVSGGFADKKIAALALAVCSVTYGAGQLISGYLGDKFKPYMIIFIGFLITAAMNIWVGFLQNSILLIAFWAINGFAQALMWPPLVAILSSNLSDEDYKKACVKVSWGSSFGTIAVYISAPFMIRFFSFRSVFLLSGFLALAMAIVWKIIFEKFFSIDSPAAVAAKQTEQSADKNPGFGMFAVAVLLPIMFAIVLQGALRDGVTNWTPSYISDIFGLESSVSILTGVVLPVFSLASFMATSFIYRRCFKNEMTCAAVIFILGAISALLLAIFGDKNVAFSLLFLALLVGSMHGVNLILVCMTPPYFARYGRVSLISGVINSCTYVGSAISTYGIAVFTDAAGWNNTVFLWSAIALAGAVICIIFAKKWAVFQRNM